MHGDVIRKIPFFDVAEIPELLIHVVKLLVSSYYLPGDVIVHEHEKTVDKSCMYFIVHGNVAVYHMAKVSDQSERSLCEKTKTKTKSAELRAKLLSYAWHGYMHY